jgi:hypothetical protein
MTATVKKWELHRISNEVLWSLVLPTDEAERLITFCKENEVRVYPSYHCARQGQVIVTFTSTTHKKPLVNWLDRFRLQETSCCGAHQRQTSW